MPAFFISLHLAFARATANARQTQHINKAGRHSANRQNVSSNQMSFHQTEILSKVHDQLNSFQHELSNVEITPLVSMTFASYDFCDSQRLKELISQIHKSDCPTVYNISCGDEVQRKRIIDRYNEFQVTNSVLTRGKDRLNISRCNHSQSETLYLGSSMYDIPGRIKQHLGGGNFRTYSLHLSKWIGDLAIDISLATYAISHRQQKELERPFIELIEQTLWEHYKPVFGKKSGL